MIDFTYKNSSLIDQAALDMCAKPLNACAQKMQDALTKKYDTEYASLNVLDDQELFDQVQKIAQAKKSLQPAVMVLIGIGGSSLGTIAVQQACQPPFAQDHAMPYWVADTIDPDYIGRLLAYSQEFLKSESPILLVAISKSGTTTETIANFELFLSLVKQYYPDTYQDYVVIVGDQDSPLLQYGKQNNCSVATIPKKVGGRYSVFSAAGLLPLCLLDVDISALKEGALQARKDALLPYSEGNVSMRSAALLYMHYQRNIHIADLFIFSVDLLGLGNWYRQLMGESIGKCLLRNDVAIPIGITPTISMGSNDLHSVAQLYLAGPIERYTTFVRIAQWSDQIVIPSAFTTNLPVNISHKSLGKVFDAIIDGTMAAFSKAQRPYSVFTLENKSERAIGYFMQMNMMQMMYLGALFQVNPFDQPQVELYKEETRRILTHE